jgi:hypothetical protein
VTTERTPMEISSPANAVADHCMTWNMVDRMTQRITLAPGFGGQWAE